MAKLNMSEDKDFDFFIKKSLQQQADSDAPVLTDDLISQTMNRIHEEAEASGHTTTPVSADTKKRRHYLMPVLTTAACLLLLGGVIFTLAKNGVFLSNDSTKNSSDASFDIAEATDTASDSGSSAELYDSEAPENYASGTDESPEDSTTVTESSSEEEDSMAVTSEDDSMIVDEDDSMMEESEDEIMTEDSFPKDFTTPDEEISGSQKPLYENEKADSISNFSFATYFSGREEKRPELIQILTSDSETIYNHGTKKYNRIYRQLNEELYEYRDEAYEEVTLTEVLTDYEKKILLFYQEEDDYYTETALYLYEDVLYVFPDDFTTYDLTTLTPAVKVKKFCRQES